MAKVNLTAYLLCTCYTSTSGSDFEKDISYIRFLDRSLKLETTNLKHSGHDSSSAAANCKASFERWNTCHSAVTKCMVMLKLSWTDRDRVSSHKGTCVSQTNNGPVMPLLLLVHILFIQLFYVAKQ